MHIIPRMICYMLPLSGAASRPLRQGQGENFKGVQANRNYVNNQDGHAELDKYFHENAADGHFDERFAKKPLYYHEKRPYLTALIQTYLSFMNDIGAETWLMHGTLLGWWWNRHIMPWDSDIDMMTSEKSMDFLADFHNMTIHKFRFPGSRQLRSYLLEINPHCRNGTADVNNKIDARWIDRETGLFIDITTLRRNASAVASGDPEALMVKDGHHYRYDDVWPLRDSIFESVPVQIPFAYAEILIEEYGPEALSTSRFAEHHFSEEQQQWVTRFEDHTEPSGPTAWQRLIGTV